MRKEHIFHEQLHKVHTLVALFPGRRRNGHWAGNDANTLAQALGPGLGRKGGEREEGRRERGKEGRREGGKEGSREEGRTGGEREGGKRD